MIKTATVHSTNYINTFICVSKDSRALTGTVPPERKTPTVAALTFGMLYSSPYKYTSDDIIFGVFAKRKGIAKGLFKEARAGFFSKGQPCLRCSALAKTYGWGFHHDGNAKVAIYAVGSKEYGRLASDETNMNVRYAMRARR